MHRFGHPQAMPRHWAQRLASARAPAARPATPKRALEPPTARGTGARGERLAARGLLARLLGLAARNPERRMIARFQGGSPTVSGPPAVIRLEPDLRRPEHTAIRRDRRARGTGNPHVALGINLHSRDRFDPRRLARDAGDHIPRADAIDRLKDRCLASQPHPDRPGDSTGTLDPRPARRGRRVAATSPSAGTLLRQKRAHRPHRENEPKPHAARRVATGSVVPSHDLSSITPGRSAG